VAVAGFALPDDLSFNRGAVADPGRFAEDAGARSWLFLCGEEFAAMDWGISYDQVQEAVPESENIVSDPPVDLDMALARQHIAALDRLPRPTLVTCRTGPRSAAVVYLYAGLRAGAAAEEVLARADADDAPFAGVPEYRAFVAQGLEELATEA
jgi:hypothetical protein